MHFVFLSLPLNICSRLSGGVHEDNAYVKKILLELKVAGTFPRSKKTKIITYVGLTHCQVSYGDTFKTTL